MKRHAALTLFLVISAAPLNMAQRLTIPEAVERVRPGPYQTSRVRELVPLPFDFVVEQSDLLVHGSLKKLSTYLSKDQTELYTDYEVIPTTIIAQRHLHATAQPGPNQIVIRQWGGQTQINGVDVKISDENFPLLPTNTPLLLFLSFNEKIDKYEIFGTVMGAFELKDGTRLRHLVTPALASYEPYNGMNLSDAVREIHRLGR